MNGITRKTIDSIVISDLERYPVWEFINDDSDEMALKPVLETLPLMTLDGRVVGTKILLSNGELVWARIANIDVNDAISTMHFCTICIDKDGIWFPLARYHDSSYERLGPSALAKFLDLNIDEVFPITYDLRQYSVGNPDALVGKVFKTPKETLDENELIALALRKR